MQPGQVQVRTEVPAEVSTSFLDLGVFCFSFVEGTQSPQPWRWLMAAGGGCRLAMVVTFRGWQLAYFLPCRKGSGLGSLPMRRCCDVTLPAEPKGRTELRVSPGGEDMAGPKAVWQGGVGSGPCHPHPVPTGARGISDTVPALAESNATFIHKRWSFLALC